jgi:hypothetical protein
MITQRNSNEWFKTFVKYAVPLYEKTSERLITEVKKETWALNWPTERKIWYDKQISNSEIKAILKKEKKNSQIRLDQLINKGAQVSMIEAAKSLVVKWENTLRFYYNQLEYY